MGYLEYRATLTRVAKMKIIILGSTGMLGNAVGKYFLQKYGDDAIYLSYRNKDLAYGKNNFYFDPLKNDFNSIPNCDYMINCIGVIKPFMQNHSINSIKINSIFPRMLANHCTKNNIKLIHITTDCVFSGKKGSYTERDLHDCLDDYGKTKSLGEPNNCMVIRTSIIGEEIHKNASLISWVKSQAGKQVNGFSNHFWNGITTKQYAKICDKIIQENLYKPELFHVFSDTVNKFELLHLINDKFNLDLTINDFKTEKTIDRTLATNKNLNRIIKVPNLNSQIEDL